MVRTSRKRAAAGGLPLAGVSVMVADDDRVSRRIVADAVERAGGTAATAADGAEAVRLAAGREFDAAVLDFRMPGLDGADVCAALRAAGFRGPILGLTAEASPAEVDVWHASGCADVLAKGAPQERIVARLAEALGRLHAER